MLEEPPGKIALTEGFSPSEEAGGEVLDPDESIAREGP